MQTTPRRALAIAALIGSVATFPAAALVNADEAARLKGTLTPAGAEKAGNKDGTIPEFDGGLATPSPGFRNGGKRPDPFAAEKPIVSIGAKNMDAYADRLSDGVKAMLKKYPDTYRVDVYPTHRTAAMPKWIADNTFRNATQATLVDGPGGLQPQGAYGGVPFPIPKSGAEAIWNHLTRWRGGSWHWDATQYLNTSDGKHVLTNNGAAEQLSPYWNKDGSPEKFNGDYYLIRLVNAGPPIRAGEAIVGRQNFNDDKSGTWVYITGQRRVRKLPNACCDTPSPTTAGVMSFDDIEVFSGRINKFDWKLVGKKEMLVPYNSNRTMTAAKDADVLGDHHLNPDQVRWELHRVWVVESTLAGGQRHAAVRSTYYLDEDSWIALLGDRWDANGQLWKTMWQIPFAAPDVPGQMAKTFGFYDLLSGTWYVNGLFNEKAEQYRVTSGYSDTLFTSDALAGEGVR